MSSGVQDLGPNTANGSAASPLLSPFSSYYVIDDFTWGDQASAPYGPFGFFPVGAAGGGIFTQANIPASATFTGRIGLQPFGVGTSNNNTGNGAFFSDGLSFYPGQTGTATLDFGFYVPTAYDGTKAYIMEMGFRNSFNSGTAPNSMVIRYSGSDSANWMVYTSNNGTGTLTTSSLAVSGTSWYNGRIAISGSAVTYSISPPGGTYTALGQHTTALPNAAHPSYLCFIIYRSATYATNAFMVVDWVSLTSTLNR